MPNRRDFIAAGAGGFLSAAAALSAAHPFCNKAALAAAAADPDSTGPRKKLAIITTEWRYRSHAWHMGERFLVGYPKQGHWYQPPFEVVSAYVDQHPDNDLSASRAREFGFTLYPSVAEALCTGGDTLAVDAVLIIGEHGSYEKTEFGQTKYPRYEFFKQTADVFRASGRSVPVFNDKHLSWNYRWAQEMVALSKELQIPFLAGSSLPVTFRMPSIDLPHGAPVEEVMCVAMGGIDSYDFHALEVIQCMAERRAGGETGVAKMHAIRGDAVWQAMAAGSFASGGWSPRLFEACLSRSHTLAQPESFSHRYPSEAQIKDWVKEPVAYRFEYRDGLKATMLLMNGLVEDFTFAATLKGQEEPLSTLFHLPPNPNVVYSAALMSKAEENFVTGQPPYPIERTLLTTGLVEAGVQSLVQGPLETPQLDVQYHVKPDSTFWNS